MVHVLAVMAGLMLRQLGRSRGFFGGFLIAGILVVMASIVWSRAIIDALFKPLESTRFIKWLNSLPELIGELLAIGIVASLILITQLALACLGGWIGAVWMGRRTSAVEPEPRPSRWSVSLVIVIVLLMPALAIEGYLRWVIDPRELRREAGSEAIIDLSGRPALGGLYPAKMVALNGHRVRINRDLAPCVVEQVAMQWSPGQTIQQSVNLPVVEHTFHIRSVEVTILDGDQAGQTTTVMHCFLRPVPKP
jgi:hypothetical protein